MRRANLGLMTAFGIMATFGGAAWAGTVTIVRVRLQDPSTDNSVASMRVSVDRDSAKAGPVRFQVTNESKTLVHEMIVIKTNAPATALPYDSKADSVNESRIKSLGEVSELRPTGSGRLTLNMKPGTYLLFCNQPGHLHGGMWARFVVTPR
jgi:uncharacterized cupredoxin-like copper-binding protein